MLNSNSISIHRYSGTCNEVVFRFNRGRSTPIKKMLEINGPIDDITLSL